MPFAAHVCLGYLNINEGSVGIITHPRLRQVGEGHDSVWKAVKTAQAAAKERCMYI